MKRVKPQGSNSNINPEGRFGIFVLEYLKKNGPATVQRLHEVLTIADLSLTRAEVTDLVWRLAEQDKITLEDAPLTTRSFAEFLGLWEKNMWLYGSLLVSLATVLAVYAMPATYPLVILRWALGSLFTLFIPGYVTAQALFPRSRDLDAVERYALSMGLSLVEVPLVCLLLNSTPWGIQLTSVVFSLTILIVGLSVLALARQYASIQ